MQIIPENTTTLYIYLRISQLQKSISVHVSLTKVFIYLSLYEYVAKTESKKVGLPAFVRRFIFCNLNSMPAAQMPHIRFGV